MARSTPAIASGRAPHLACRKLRSTACPWAGGDRAAGEELPRLSSGPFPASTSVVAIENVGGKEPVVRRGRPSGTSFRHRACSRGRSGAEFSETGIDARALPAGCEIGCARKPFFGSDNLALRNFGWRIGRLRIHRSPRGLHGGLRIRRRIFRRVLDGLVERCLFWSHLLILRHGRVTPSGSCLHEQEDGPDLVSPQMKDKRILLGDAGEYLEVNRPSTTGMEFCRGSESRRFRNHFFDLNM